MAVWCGDHVTLPSATGTVPLFADHGINLTQVRYCKDGRRPLHLNCGGLQSLHSSLEVCLQFQNFQFRAGNPTFKKTTFISTYPTQHPHQHSQPNIHIDLSLDCLWHTSYHRGTLLGPWIFTCWSSAGLVFFPACPVDCACLHLCPQHLAHPRERCQPEIPIIRGHVCTLCRRDGKHGDTIGSQAFFQVKNPSAFLTVDRFKINGHRKQD